MKLLSRLIRNLLLTLLCFCIVLHRFEVNAEELESSRSRLDKIQNQIEKTLEGLRSKQSESGVISEDIDRLNIEVRRISRLKRKSDQQLSALDGQIDEKWQENSKLEKELSSTEERIRKRLIVLYKSGEVGFVKALLSGTEGPKDIAEKYTLLSRMVRHDRELLNDYRVQSSEQVRVLEELEVLRKKQSGIVLRREKEQKTLQRAKKTKEVLLAKVAKDTDLLEKMLAELRAKKARLNDLVKKLETEQPQTYTEKLNGLKSYKGHLFWPVEGQLRTGYGKSRNEQLGTLIESHGYVISAEVGSPVNAVAKGKVIFANNLRGFGKLVILDHGEKYYTLYAHLARFKRQVGDVIGAGEILAYSGFEGRDSIYFEIRFGGEPMNPGAWLKKR